MSFATVFRNALLCVCVTLGAHFALAQGTVPYRNQVPYPVTGGTTSRADKDRWLDNGINILEFGADPSGTKDSAAAIQAAIDYGFNNNNPNIYCPNGRYKTTIPIYMDPPNNMRGGAAWTENNAANYSGGTVVSYGGQYWVLNGTDSPHDWSEPGSPQQASYGEDFAWQIVNSTNSVTYAPTFGNVAAGQPFQNFSAGVVSFKGSGAIGTPISIGSTAGSRGTNGIARMGGQPFTTELAAPTGSTIIITVLGGPTNTTPVTSITDSAGHTYVKAVNVVGTPTIAALDIWYSINIATPLPAGGHHHRQRPQQQLGRRCHRRRQP
jgi:hypothetical protein